MRTDARRQEALDRVGTRIGGKWFLDEMLGFGGCATVYAATHRNGARAAVKLLHPNVMSDDILRTRFIREGYVANKVAHPGVVSVLDDDRTEEGLPYLVMELLEGRSLERPLGGEKKMPVHEMVRVADAVLDVLINAHAAGIVHRDIKPANIFVTHSGQVKVLDFGIARLADASRDPEQTGATQTGIMMGTATYMPPEQARARWGEVDGRSDLFALGATMLALVLGRRPRQADTANEDFLMAMTEGMPPAMTLAPELPKSIADVIDRACAFKRDDRFFDAAMMQQALRQSVHPQANVGRRGPESDTRVQVKTKVIVGDSNANPVAQFANTVSPNMGPNVGYESSPRMVVTPRNEMANIAVASPLANTMDPFGGSTTRAVFHPGSLPPATGKTEIKPRGGGATAFVIIAALLAMAGLALGGLYLRAHRRAEPTQEFSAVPPPAVTTAVPEPAQPTATETTLEPAPATSVITANTVTTTTTRKPKPKPATPAPASSAKFYDERF